MIDNFLLRIFLRFLCQSAGGCTTLVPTVLRKKVFGQVSYAAFAVFGVFFRPAVWCQCPGTELQSTQWGVTTSFRWESMSRGKVPSVDVFFGHTRNKKRPCKPVFENSGLPSHLANCFTNQFLGLLVIQQNVQVAVSKTLCTTVADDRVHLVCLCVCESQHLLHRGFQHFKLTSTLWIFRLSSAMVVFVS